MYIVNRQGWRNTYIQAAERESDPAAGFYWMSQAREMTEQIRHLQNGCTGPCTGLDYDTACTFVNT